MIRHTGIVFVVFPQPASRPGSRQMNQLGVLGASSYSSLVARSPSALTQTEDP